jgi:outer membrane protein W
MRIVYRVLFLLFVVAGALRSRAQTTDVSAWVVDSELSESTFTEDGQDIDFDFDEEVGWGLSLNHFWTPRFSTELAVQKYGAELHVNEFKAGDLDVTSTTLMGQWHFNRAGRFSPYVGAGIAKIGGEFEFVDLVEDPAPERISLETEITWTLAFGANINLDEHWAITGEMKYVPWDAKEKNGSQIDDAVEVDPATFAAGVRFRF